MGKLIVLEGIDGSGKSSQYRRVCERLDEDGISFSHIVFPRYDKESSALLRLYLGGAFGSKPGDVNAYTASTFFAVDRFASYRDDWGEIYHNGGLILSDRYTTSNVIHQGSKLPDEELPAFFRVTTLPMTSTMLHLLLISSTLLKLYELRLFATFTPCI